MPTEPYKKYGALESPKVIVLQDSNPPPMTDGRPDKVTPPSGFHPRSRSPMRDDIRTLAEMEVARRRGHGGHHYGYPGKEWGDGGDARHMMEEESRRRLMDESRSRSTGLMCKDKNCNGVSVEHVWCLIRYMAPSNSLHDRISVSYTHLTLPTICSV